jgi:hypothetical protein
MAFNKKLGFFVAPMLLALGGAGAATGCSEDGSNPLDEASGALCCDDFEVGADLSGANFGVDAELEGKFKVYAQAMADLSGVAAATLGDIEVACGNIAADLGASAEDLKTANAAKGTAKVEALCNLATAQIDGYFGAQGEFSAQGSLAIDFQEPHCSASVSAKADCQASCSGSAECDVKANPPTCEGGKLQVSCEGSCTAEAGASVACEGKCEGSCSGSCQAAVNATVDCQGKCEGTCEAKAGVGTGTGAQADGTCHGTCSGTCTMDADAQVECTGTCKGSCDASCTAEAGASVKCDGECDGEFEPLKCEGGELKGGCEVEASCDANCNASASAKAECTPPSLTVVFEASGNASLEVDAQARLDVALNSLKANLPNILVAVKARGGAFMSSLEASVNAGVDVVADPGALGGKGAICFTKIAAAGATALGNMKASVEAAGSVTGSLEL